MAIVVGAGMAVAVAAPAGLGAAVLGRAAAVTVAGLACCPVALRARPRW